MLPVLERTRWSKPAYEQAARKMVETGGGTLSHPVGLAVHDDGPYNRGPLKVGHVFSIDPQLWVPEENLYIRYEDVIVVTPAATRTSPNSCRRHSMNSSAWQARAVLRCSCSRPPAQMAGG